MLRKEAVSPALSEVLTKLMLLDGLSNHRLVGGTALALKIGHRISVDIDLFSDTKSDYLAIEKEVFSAFAGECQLVHYIHSPLGNGISLVIKGIKTDILDWSKSFYYSVELNEGIRMASKEEIASMKLDIITSPPEFIRFEKKDFVDLAILLQDFTLAQLIEIFRKRNPGIAFPERIVLEALQSAELADKKPHPRMIKPLEWNATKSKINEAIQHFLNEENFG